MESLIRQIAKSLENNRHMEKTEAAGSALQEVVLSGLNRCGFFRECVFVPDAGVRDNNNFYCCFLRYETGNEFEIEQYLPYVADELDAAGVKTGPVKTKNGFQVSDESETGDEKLFLYVFVYQKPVRNLKVQISYNPAPLPYELKTAGALPKAVSDEIQKTLEKCIKAEKTSEKKKKEAKRQNTGKKRQNPGEQWIQPSLFDF